MKPLLTLLLTLSLASTVSAAEGPKAEADASSRKGRDYEEATAKVEQVFRAEEEGYVAIAYVVTWHGKKVVVNDPIHDSDLKAGDRIHFLVMWHDMSTPEKPQKLLSFQVLPF